MIDIETVLIGWLEDTIEDVRASTETPADLDERLPWLRVKRVAGPYDGFRLDRPAVDIEAFAQTGAEASALALQIQQLMHDEFARATVGGAVISEVTTLSGPHETPYGNPNLRRYEASYSLVVHPA